MKLSLKLATTTMQNYNISCIVCSAIIIDTIDIFNHENNVNVKIYI